MPPTNERGSRAVGVYKTRIEAFKVMRESRAKGQPAWVVRKGTKWMVKRHV